jgi:hypothetical protein
MHDFLAGDNYSHLMQDNFCSFQPTDRPLAMTFAPLMVAVVLAVAA